MANQPLHGCGSTGCQEQVAGTCNYCGIPLCERHSRILESAEPERYCALCFLYLSVSGLIEKPFERNTIPHLLVVNQNKCTGCRSCELACSFFHFKEFNYEESAIHVLKNEAEGRNRLIICVHCTDPDCVKSCPTEALTKNEETHTVALDREKCILCGQCVEVCPYHAIFFNRDKTKIILCDLCGGNPSCAKVCAPEAVEWVKKYRFGERKRAVLNLSKLGE
jgi:anaerobic carbon-monoxide dehydrogenase iron sulfur subunit